MLPRRVVTKYQKPDTHNKETIAGERKKEVFLKNVDVRPRVYMCA